MITFITDNDGNFFDISKSGSSILIEIKSGVTFDQISNQHVLKFAISADDPNTGKSSATVVIDVIKAAIPVFEDPLYKSNIVDGPALQVYTYA